MSTTLYSARIIEGPSLSRFTLALAANSSEEISLRLTLSEDREIIYEQWTTWINFNSVKCSTRLDGMYTVQDGYWNIQYDPLRRAGHIVAAGVRAGYDDIIAGTTRVLWRALASFCHSQVRHLAVKRF